MKKLAMSALFVMLLFGSAVAHDGALSLYTDASITVCSAAIAAFETDTISLFYVRGTGANLGNAVEFRLEASTVDALFLGYEWNSQIVVTLGDPLTGISLTGSTCLGGDESVVYIGSIYIMYTGFASPPDDRFTVMVKEDPAAQPPGIYITECTPQNPIRQIIGGTFVFNGSCSPSVKESTWGSIKALYK